MKYLKWPIYATKVHKTELSNFTKNEIVLHPKHGAPPAPQPPLSWVSYFNIQYIKIFELFTLSCLPDSCIHLFTCLCSLDLCLGTHRCRYPDRIWNRFLVIQFISIFFLTPHQSLYLDLHDTIISHHHHHHRHIFVFMEASDITMTSPSRWTQKQEWQCF